MLGFVSRAVPSLEQWVQEARLPDSILASSDQSLLGWRLVLAHEPSEIPR